MKKKSSQSAVIYTPGSWTGNNIFLKGGLIVPVLAGTILTASLGTLSVVCAITKAVALTNPSLSHTSE